MLQKLILFSALACPVIAGASATDVRTVRLTDPLAVRKPVVIDSVDAAQRKFSSFDLLNSPVVLGKAAEGKVVDLSADSALTCGTKDSPQIRMAAFSFNLSGYTKAQVKVSGPRSYAVYINGNRQQGKQDMQCGQYDVVVKYLADTLALKLSVEADRSELLSVSAPTEGTPAKRPFSMADVMQQKYYTGVALSPSGKYATYCSFWTDSQGRGQRQDRIVETATGRILSTMGGLRWMPKTDRLLTTRNVDGKNQLISIDPTDMSETVLCAELPETSYSMSPTEDFLILHKLAEGPKRENGVYEILMPDDRQPGWRNRYMLQKLDLKTGLTQTLTYGNKKMYLNDIAPDGKSIIFSFSEERLAKRPLHVSTYCRLNLETLECDTLISREGFVSNISFVPGTQKLVITATAEAFDRIGCTLPRELTPSQYDYQLFLYDLSSRKIEPLTRNFDPSIASVKTQDKGIVYFTANKADSICLYRLDANKGEITPIDLPVELVTGFDVAQYGNLIYYTGCGACMPDRLLALNTKNLKSQLVDDANAERMAQISLGECKPFRIMSTRGYPLTGHYYLPANFDPTKKYPVIVHYYGGCTPTSRRFGGGSHYPAHYWNAMGYITLICNPSGASGFGQEWASRHVNTMGEGVAQDIIEMVEHFRDDNPWVDGKAIGCVSASYGGFMTQLLLTKTDMFAAGISHAGISDHTSYWGEGYWGYTYSEVSAANSYPWTRKDLYVDRSPLYNADKIKTPLLFTHGTADTNVPIGESIQMYTALKLLGVPTAFVMVEGENHGIMDFHKRPKWINTMVAWFDKYLKRDTTWWDAIYTPKELK